MISGRLTYIIMVEKVKEEKKKKSSIWLNIETNRLTLKMMMVFLTKQNFVHKILSAPDPLRTLSYLILVELMKIP